jgi:hypothetical protein
VVRVAAEEVDDPVQLSIGEPECPVDGKIVKRLCGDPGQSASVPAAPDGTRRRKETRRRVVLDEA